MATSFRVMTANLLHDGVDPGWFGEFLDRVAADVVVTQELNPECAGVVAQRYPNHHLDPARDITGRGIATSLPGEFGDIPMPVRDGTWALLQVDGRLVRVAGMHLANPIKFPWWTSVRNRGRQLEALLAWTDSADSDIPLLVIGDMNASPRWPAYRLMAERWDDLVARCAEESGVRPERTWAWRPGWVRVLRIDHMFGVSVRATSVSSEPLQGSDHWAVVADLVLA